MRQHQHNQGFPTVPKKMTSPKKDEISRKTLNKYTDSLFWTVVELELHFGSKKTGEISIVFEDLSKKSLFF